MTVSTGRSAEEVAGTFLKNRGLKILAHNVTYPFGELDIVALDQKTLVFIEVKYRQSLAFGLPLEAVSKSKQRKIIMAAKAYLQKWQGPFPSCRFDVLSLSGDLKDPIIDHIEDAFWAEEL